MTHLKDESLSAFIDGEVDKSERAVIQAHLDECADCAARRVRLESVGAALASIPEVTPTPDEARALRRALLDRRPKRWARLAPAAWAAAGGSAILIIGFVTFATLRGPKDRDTTAAPERALPTAETIAISSENQELVDLVRGDEEIQSQVGKYRVSEVQSRQQDVLADYGAAAPAPAAAAQQESAKRDAASTTEATAAAPVERDLGYCLRAWVNLRANSVPITGRPASFQGQPAWLLVYAYSPTDDPNSRLDHLTVLVVRRSGCERDDAILRALPIRPSPTPPG